jgi:elongation factor Ts
MEIKASDVKILREKTGAGMMDCRNALVKSEGDFAKAEKLLREEGISVAEKRIGRATNEGKIFSKIDGAKGVMLELDCETDFVARNQDFIDTGAKLVEMVFADKLREPNAAMQTLVTEIISKIKENIILKRFTVVEAGAGEILVNYIHSDKLGVIVKVRADKAEALADQRVRDFAFDVALHVAAFNPKYLDRSKIDAGFIKEQEEIFTKQAEGLNKPANVLQGIIKGKVNKYLADICLMDQGFVKDEKVKVAAAVAEISKLVGATVTVAEYLYYKVGE